MVNWVVSPSSRTFVALFSAGVTRAPQFSPLPCAVQADPSTVISGAVRVPVTVTVAAVTAPVVAMVFEPASMSAVTIGTTTFTWFVLMVSMVLLSESCTIRDPP
jgi:hypothetical protein